MTAILENRSEKPIGLDQVMIEMTTYDFQGGVSAKGYPFTFDGAVAPLSTTRIPLHRPGRGIEIRSSKLFLKDLQGRLLSEIDVPPIAEENLSSPGASLPPAGQTPAGAVEFKNLMAPR